MMASKRKATAAAPLDVRIWRRVLHEMRGDGNRGTLLTSHTADFPVTVLLCFITPQITAVRNVQIHFGRGRDLSGLVKIKKTKTKQTPSPCWQLRPHKTGRETGKEKSVCFSKTLSFLMSYFIFSTPSAFFF